MIPEQPFIFAASIEMKQEKRKTVIQFANWTYLRGWVSLFIIGITAIGAPVSGVVMRNDRTSESNCRIEKTIKHNWHSISVWSPNDTRIRRRPRSNFSWKIISFQFPQLNEIRVLNNSNGASMKRQIRRQFVKTFTRQEVTTVHAEYCTETWMRGTYEQY